MPRPLACCRWVAERDAYGRTAGSASSLSGFSADPGEARRVTWRTGGTKFFRLRQRRLGIKCCTPGPGEAIRRRSALLSAYVKGRDGRSSALPELSRKSWRDFCLLRRRRLSHQPRPRSDLRSQQRPNQTGRHRCAPANAANPGTDALRHGTAGAICQGVWVLVVDDDAIEEETGRNARRRAWTTISVNP
jgi:hypothetical protein